jgi:hypothetical protein
MTVPYDPTDINIARLLLAIYRGEGCPPLTEGLYNFSAYDWKRLSERYHLTWGIQSHFHAAAWYLAQEADPDLYANLERQDATSIREKLWKPWPGGSQAITDEIFSTFR